jgi:hypothetical protein
MLFELHVKEDSVQFCTVNYFIVKQKKNFDNIFVKYIVEIKTKVFLQGGETLALLYFFQENMLMSWYKIRLSFVTYGPVRCRCFYVTPDIITTLILNIKFPGTCHRTVWYKFSDVSEELTASFFRTDE